MYIYFFDYVSSPVFQRGVLQLYLTLGVTLAFGSFITADDGPPPPGDFQSAPSQFFIVVILLLCSFRAQVAACCKRARVLEIWSVQIDKSTESQRIRNRSFNVCPADHKLFPIAVKHFQSN